MIRRKITGDLLVSGNCYLNNLEYVILGRIIVRGIGSDDVTIAFEQLGQAGVPIDSPPLSSDPLYFGCNATVQGSGEFSCNAVPTRKNNPPSIWAKVQILNSKLEFV